jgi:hypothetical protein
MAISLDNMGIIDEGEVNGMKDALEGLAIELNKKSFMSSTYIKEKAGYILRAIERERKRLEEAL